MLDASKLIEQASATHLRSQKNLIPNSNTHSNLHSKGSQRVVSRFFKARLSNKNYQTNGIEPTSHLGIMEEELSKNVVSNQLTVQPPKHKQQRKDRNLKYILQQPSEIQTKKN